jgi:NADPH-dependent 2,4-dienoyl-CoA reductase/sulfur reductase-like enzyme/rhodanese-related sulfurtransferase
MSAHIVIIGGSAAGPKAAARARRMDPEANITIIQKEKYLSMASCGYPYYVGGFFDDRNMLISTPTGVVRDPKFFMNAKNVVAKTESEATAIDPKKKEVTVRSLNGGKDETVTYDKLIIATGASPKMPPIPGIDLEGITPLQSLPDADYLREVRDEGNINKAVVVGGGLIGVETAEALHLAGMDVIVVEMLPHILSFMNQQLAALVENHMKAMGAHVETNNGVQEFLGSNGKLKAVKLSNGTEIPAELAVIAIGVTPNVAIAREAGVKVGDCGGIMVDEYMRTNVSDIYAIGDCTEVTQRQTGTNVHAPYGDLANLQGRVAGENAVSGNTVTYPGTVQTGICKVFDYTVGTTGLTVDAAREAGFDPVSIITAGPDKPGFMQGKPLISMMVADRKSEKILGFQCIGMGDVSKQVAQGATAIQGQLTINDAVNLDLPYAPPFQLAIDNFIGTAHVLQNKMRGLFTGISAEEVKKKTDAGTDAFILDVRGPDEYEQMRLGIGERLIPLGALRTRLDELPQDRNTEIIVYCKISLRGYEAARLLMGAGYTNVKVMEGGVLAWPYCREK